ncbi:MAG: hypothetical protein KAW47_09840, partial [Thermoplasmatales archaeon]|nr:hypothetical protein [Thermoplasmatales archaeon]
MQKNVGRASMPSILDPIDRFVFSDKNDKNKTSATKNKTAIIKKLYMVTRYVFVVNYEDLSEIRRKESSSPMPIKIEPDFYKSLARYLNSLEEELMKERKKDPNSNRATLLADELK